MTKMRFFVVLAALLLLAGFVIIPPNFRTERNTTFQKGEWMKFRVHYGWITAGYVTLFVEQQTDLRSGRKCHHIVGEGITAPSYDWVYKIRDRYETWMDEESLFAWQFNRAINEGDFHSYTETRFDQAAHKAYYTDEQKGITPYDVPADIQDVVSAFYYARAHYNHAALKPGDKISMRQFIDRKTVNLDAEMVKREAIEVAGTKYKALKFKLLVEESGMVTDDASIVFWISDDENKIPLRIEMELYFGALKVDLIGYSSLKNPATSKVN